MVNKSIVNKNHLRSHLVQLPHINSSSVESLIDPADKQNVSKAVTLIQSINQLRSLDIHSYSPSQVNEHRSLVAVGEIFSAFMDAFTTVTMALSDNSSMSSSIYCHVVLVIVQSEWLSVILYTLNFEYLHRGRKLSGPRRLSGVGNNPIHGGWHPLRVCEMFYTGHRKSPRLERNGMVIGFS